MNRNQMRLGDYLEEFPEFKFDVDEHLQATKYSFDTCRRLDATRGWIAQRSAADGDHAKASFNVRDFHTSCGASRAITLKEDLRKDIGRYVDKTALTEKFTWGKWTSGTTGRPILIPYAPEFHFDQLHLPLIRAALFADIDFSSVDVFAISLTDNPSTPEFAIADPTNTVGVSFQIVIRESDPASISRMWRLVESLRPRVISLKPVILEALLSSEVRWPDLGFLRMVFCSGSLLGDDLRRTAEVAFGCALMNAYGLTEFGIAAYECGSRSLHHDPRVFHVETIALDDEETISDEPGRLVVTTRTNPLLPLWRYCTGDVAVVTDTTCDCGRPGTRVAQLVGRVQQCFRGPSGELLSPVHFGEIFSSLHVREYQVMQRDTGVLQVVVDPLSAQDPTELAERVERELRRFVPDTWDVSVRTGPIHTGPAYQRHRVELGPQPHPLGRPPDTTTDHGFPAIARAHHSEGT